MTSISRADRDDATPSKRLDIAPTVPAHVDRVDVDAGESAAAELLVALGADLELEGLRETPRRPAAAYAELLTPEPFDLTMFPDGECYDELVLVRDIAFQSACMHHLLPFHGVAHVAYLPGERILGLSKLARVVELFARNLQLHERLTTQIPGCLQTPLPPKGVVLEAEHLCMSLRGVQKHGATTVTSTPHGLVRDDPRTRGEFIAFWLKDARVLAGMNVNVWDVNEHVQALIRSRTPVDVAALSDRDTPLDSLVAQSTTRT